MKKKHRGLKVFILLACFLLVFAKAKLDSSPNLQLLVSVLHFSESTLKNPDYLAYDIDLMDLFQNYFNSDVSYSGSLSVKDIQGFDFSVTGDISGERSCSQKKMSCEADLRAVVLTLGEMDLYADTNMIYFMVPLLGDDVAFAFDMESDLFKKGPEFTSDISREWFHDNAMNIVNFLRSIEITETADTYVTDDGEETTGYHMTIPKDQGQFIWDLIGMDSPDYDMEMTIYLDKHYHTQKLVFDLSHSIDGASLSILGENSSTAVMYVPLPDDEEAIMTITRNGDVKYTNSFDCEMVYNANNGKVYTMTSNIVINFSEDSAKTEVKDIVLKEDNITLCTAFTEARITKESGLKNIFRDLDEASLIEIERLDWKQVRDDTEDFAKELIEKSNDTIKIFD